MEIFFFGVRLVVGGYMEESSFPPSFWRFQSSPPPHHIVVARLPTLSTVSSLAAFFSLSNFHHLLSSFSGGVAYRIFCITSEYNTKVREV